MGRSLARSDNVNTHYRTPTFRAFLTSAPSGEQNHAISRRTALHAAAGSRHAAHTHLRSFRRSCGSSRLPSLPPRAKPQTLHSKLEEMAPLAARRRRQRVEIETTTRKMVVKAQRVQDGARQPSPQRRAARFDCAARPARSVVNCPPQACAGRSSRHQRVVESVRVEWGEGSCSHKVIRFLAKAACVHALGVQT